MQCLSGRITIPPAVVDEIAAGIAWEIDLPDLQKLGRLDPNITYMLTNLRKRRLKNWKQRESA